MNATSNLTCPHVPSLVRALDDLATCGVLSGDARDAAARQLRQTEEFLLGNDDSTTAAALRVLYRVRGEPT